LLLLFVFARALQHCFYLQRCVLVFVKVVHCKELVFLGCANIKLIFISCQSSLTLRCGLESLLLH